MFDLKKLNPCSYGIEFVKNCNDIFDAWNKCQRGDWMLWLASKLKIDHRLLILAKGKCAETVLHLMEDDRSKGAVKAAIEYGNRLLNLDQLQAYTADSAYISDDASDAASVAAAAANAVYVDVYVAVYADVYVGDADAASDAAYAAKKENQLKTANICRELLTDAVFEKINNLAQ